MKTSPHQLNITILPAEPFSVAKHLYALKVEKGEPENFVIQHGCLC